MGTGAHLLPVAAGGAAACAWRACCEAFAALSCSISSSSLLFPRPPAPAAAAAPPLRSPGSLLPTVQGLKVRPCALLTDARRSYIRMWPTAVARVYTVRMLAQATPLFVW